jgi:thiamine biosynthesis protein ThiS
MRILLNGEARHLAAPLSVQALLDELEIDPRVVAVEVNRVVVKRVRYPDTLIEDGAEVEIVAFVGGGSRGKVRGRRAKGADRRAQKGWKAGAILLALILLSGAATAQQTRPAAPPVSQTVSEESMLVYQGWALLAAGDAAKASRAAADALAKSPRSVAAIVLLVEAEIARAGATAGLTAYERWLGDRKVEDPYLVRRISRALLQTTAKGPGPLAGDAMRFLAEDGDAESRAELTRKAYAGSFADAKALAPLDEGIVRYLIQGLSTTTGSKLAIIDALVASRSKLAIPPLMALLGDTATPAHIAAAADGLGKLGATDAIPRLRPLVANPAATGEVRWTAAAALFRLGDKTGEAVLQKSFESDNGALRLAAVEAMSSRPDGAWQGVVRSLTADTNQTVRMQAAKLIAPYDNTLARITLEAGLASRTPEIQAFAAQILAESVATDFAMLRRLIRSTTGLAQLQAAARVLQLTR